MQIDKEFKDFELKINGLRALEKIDDYQHQSLLIMKLTQKCLEGIDYKLNDILNKLILK
jgi:hypothetical protein